MKLPAHKKLLSAAAAASVLLMTAACGSSEDADAGTSAPASSEAAPTADAPSDAADEAPADATAAYADGDYEASGSYSNPGGTSSVGVSLTLEGGSITAVEVEPEASGTSLQFQKKFASGIADEVVGKSLDEIDVSKVAGSSLTSGGFNEAIEQIKAEAQA
ncbi:MAG: FMN-binding protein [Aeromicrobium sp.]